MDPASPLQRLDKNDLLVSTSRCVETELRQLMRGVTGLYDRELRRAGKLRLSLRSDVVQQLYYVVRHGDFFDT